MTHAKDYEDKGPSPILAGLLGAVMGAAVAYACCGYSTNPEHQEPDAGADAQLQAELNAMGATLGAIRLAQQQTHGAIKTLRANQGVMWDKELNGARRRLDLLLQAQIAAGRLNQNKKDVVAKSKAGAADEQMTENEGTAKAEREGP